MSYTCNGSPKGCERERFGGCDYHEAEKPSLRIAAEASDENLLCSLDLTKDQFDVLNEAVLIGHGKSIEEIVVQALQRWIADMKSV